MKKLLFSLLAVALVAFVWVPVPTASATESYSILTDTKLPDATVGQVYAGGIDYTSNTTYPLNSSFNSLPSGLRTGVGSDTLNNYNMTPNLAWGKGTVYITGTPTTAGTYTFNLFINNPNWSGTGMSGVSKQFTLTVKPAQSQSPSITITTSTLPAATVGQPYSAEINFTKTTNYALNATISGQPSGIGWHGVSGLNANVGIIFNNTTISGTPTQAGTYTVRLTLTDQYNLPVSKDFTLIVSPEATIPSSSGINLPDGTVLKVPGDPTVYKVIGGQLQPFTSANEFLGQGYKWTDVQEVDSNQVANVPLSGGNTPSFYPYPSGSLINDNGTIYFISGRTKAPFTNWQAFVGLGYLLKNVVVGDLTNYATGSNYSITTANAEHPWGSWLIYNGTVYYASQDGLIGVPSAEVFNSNGGNWNLLVKANSYDVAALNANLEPSVLQPNDPRVYTESAQ